MWRKDQAVRKFQALGARKFTSMQTEFGTLNVSYFFTSVKKCDVTKEDKSFLCTQTSVQGLTRDAEQFSGQGLIPVRPLQGFPDEKVFGLLECGKPVE
jgi:hypothetical protein